MRLRVLLTLVALLSAGCGGSGAGGEAQETETVTAATDPGSGSPLGEYEREVTADEIIPTPGQEVPPPGTWHLTVGETVIQVVDAGGFRFSQELTVSDGTLTLERYLGGDGVFCEEDAPSSYTWKLEGDELKLAAEEDDCRDRVSILGATWHKTG